MTFVPEDLPTRITWLKLATATTVADYLSQIPEPRDDTQWERHFDEDEIAAVLSRNDDFLDLMVAHYEFDGSMLRPLWDRADAQLRRAILANRRRSIDFCNDEQLVDLLRNGTDEEVLLLVGSAPFGARKLKALFNKAPPFIALDENAWLRATSISLENPNFRSPRKRNVMRHEELPPIAGAFNLLWRAPNTSEYAHRLLKLDTIAFKLPYSGTDFDEEKGHENQTDEAVQRDLDALRALIARWANSGCDLTRMIVSKLPTTSPLLPLLLNDENADVRAGCGQAIPFETVESVNEGIEALGADFLYCSSNPSLHDRYNPSVAKHVRQVVPALARRHQDFIDGPTPDEVVEYWRLSAARLHEADPRDYLLWELDDAPHG